MTLAHARHLLVAAGVAAALAACGTPAATPVALRGDVVAVQAGTLTADDVAAAQTGFGIDLLHALCAQTPGQNVLFSPTSAAQALNLLYPATRGETATSVGSLLHLPAWAPDSDDGGGSRSEWFLTQRLTDFGSSMGSVGSTRCGAHALTGRGS